MRTQLHIGEVAQLLGVTTKTIRHYQKIGLLSEPGRTSAGYRLFTAQDVLRLQRIRRLQSFGLSLKQIKKILGDPQQEHTLREVLLSLDQELAAQVRELEERRKKIQELLREQKPIEQLSLENPTIQFMEEHLADYLAQVSPAMRELEMKIYAILGSFRWSEDYQEQMQQAMLQAMPYLTEHAQEYRELLVLGERLAAIASLPEEAPEVTQLIHDFIQYFQTFSFWLERLGQSSYPTNQAFSNVASEMIASLLTPSQIRVLREAFAQYTLRDANNDFPTCS